MFADNITWELEDGFFLRQVPRDDYKKLLDLNIPKIFDSSTQVFRIRESLTANELEKVLELSSRGGDPVEFRFGIYKENEFIGWSYSRQEMGANLYMQTSAIFPEYRRLGLYTKVLKKVLELACDRGFLSIVSRHVVTNNAIIIAKMKLGFQITGLEINDGFGTLVQLSYYPNALRKKMMDYRAGFAKPDEEVKRLLKI